jgi:hypothetical protein
VLALDVPVVVEVAGGTDQQAALDDIAAAVDDDADVIAKFRTGATPSRPWPDEQALGGFLDAVILHGLSFKLTGGLHHAVRGRYSAEQQHGLLNVVIATHEALAGAEGPELAHVLGQTSAELLAERVSRLTAVDAARVRASFTAYGCCGVLDPLVELAALGLIAAGAASAADLPSRKGPVVAPVYVPAFTWTGFYVGANAGWGFGNM